MLSAYKEQIERNTDLVKTLRKKIESLHHSDLLGELGTELTEVITALECSNIVIESASKTIDTLEEYSDNITNTILKNI